jgi:hypothetical protein
MNIELIEKIAGAVLYEGYILYPYRPTSVKNQQRFTFGVVTPRSYSEAQRGTERWRMQTQVLLKGSENTLTDVKVRFLHLRERRIYDAGKGRVSSIEVEGKLYQSWQEAVEREIVIPAIDVHTLEEDNLRFTFPATEWRENVLDEKGAIAAVIYYRQPEISGDVSVAAEKIEDRLYKLTVKVENSTHFHEAERKTRDEALAHSLVSAHTILTVERGDLISLLEPAEEYRGAVAACQNIGTYPVLVGETGETDAMLSSPIILYDYPEIAAESPGELFDGTEIDEILTLRILTMTDEEKREMISVDERARKILERTETLSPEEFMRLHGVLRRPRAMSGA